MDSFYNQKPRDVLFCAGFITGALFLLALLVRRVYPFGDKCILRMDLYHQYAPFLAEFRRKILSGGSLSFSWDLGLGTNFAALYAYYLASPANWLIAFCPEGLVIEFITFMIFLKTVLASVSMTYYLLRHSGRSPVYAAFFGIFYAMSGYMAAYNWNIMWLDCVWIFPVIVLGLEGLVRDGKCALYVVALAFSIISNYYISIMICFFLPAIFLTVTCLACKKAGQAGAAALRFALSSVLAAAMAAVTVFPAAFALRSTASGSFRFPEEIETYFSILQILARHMLDVTCEEGLTHASWPNIYCGVAVYQLIPLYILNRKISLREKAAYLSMCFMMMLIFSVNVLSFIFHGFHFPNSMPARMSFIYIFLVLFMSFRVLEAREGNTKREFTGAFLASSAFILVCQELTGETQDGITVGSVALSLVFSAVYFLTALSAASNRRIKRLAFAAFLGIVTVETGYNFIMTGLPVTGRSAYLENNGDLQELVSRHAGEPCRFREAGGAIRNRGAWLGYQSADVFSSTAPAGVTEFMQEMGTDSSRNYYSGNGGTPFADSLLGIGFVIAPCEKLLDPHYRPVDSEGSLMLYEAPGKTSFGFVLPEGLSPDMMSIPGDPAASQNMFSSALGKGAVLIRTPGASDGGAFSFKAEKDGHYFVLPDLMNINEVKVIKDSGEEWTVLLSRHRFFLDVGFLNAGEGVRLIARDQDDTPVAADMKAYRFDYDAFLELNDRMTGESLSVISQTEEGMTGSVTSGKGGILFLAVPYGDGWTVTVDGSKVNPEKVFGAFLGVSLTEGTHTVGIRYTAPGVMQGRAVSLSAFLLFFFLLFLERKGAFCKAGAAERQMIESEAPDVPENAL